jgi:NADP-dependent aldehyde dehydrogenase
MNVQPVLIDGSWLKADASSTFHAFNPATMEPLPDAYPISSWNHCDQALTAAAEAARVMRKMSGERFGDFLASYADRIEARKDALVQMACLETALPASPRLADVELPRTTDQLRKAAMAAHEGSWLSATIDTKTNIRSCFAPLGPVCVFGPNNFPFAFNSVAGGDFAAAIAAGNPVIAKANSSHPGTTRLFAEAALEAVYATGMPTAIVQLIYRTSHGDGERLVADPRTAATAYTGSRRAGLNLKGAADTAGKLIYLELSSINPVIILPGALRERAEAIAEELKTSALMGTGQFCTSPGLIVLLDGTDTERFVSLIATKYRQAPAGTLLSERVWRSLQDGIKVLKSAGAEPVGGEGGAPGKGFSCPNTLLRVTGRQFLDNSRILQTEAFGNCSLLVVSESVNEAAAIVDQLEGNLTGCIYSQTGGDDDKDYNLLADRLRSRVGRLLNDKMPTGVAVSAAMNHGGPYPATGHPGFTAVGMPAAIRRFAALQCYDNVRPHRLPACLQDKNPNGHMWRYIDGDWTRRDIGEPT